MPDSIKTLKEKLSENDLKQIMASTSQNMHISNNNSDALDLAGILNTLDGVIDCPSRIVIITTNHPEQLDSALIRPGRCDQIIELKEMQKKHMLMMMSHYFQQKISQY